MTRFPFIVAIMSFVLCLAQPGWAKGELEVLTTWRIGKLSGDAWIEAPNREKMRLRSDRVLFPGQTLITADRTRLQLVHGKQRIQVGSNTVLSLPLLEETEPGKTKIYQLSGTTHLLVDKREIKHFSVETPYMVAAVKGTQFTVEIENGHAGVRVHEGLVEVASKLYDEVYDVAAGQAISMKIDGFHEGDLKPIKMAFFDRGEDVSSSSASDRAKPHATANAPQGVMALISSIFAAVTLYLSGLVNASINSVTGQITGLVVPLAHKVQYDSSVRMMMFGAAALVVIIAVVGFILYRRKRFKVDLSRTRF